MPILPIYRNRYPVCLVLWHNFIISYQVRWGINAYRRASIRINLLSPCYGCMRPTWTISLRLPEPYASNKNETRFFFYVGSSFDIITLRKENQTSITRIDLDTPEDTLVYNTIYPRALIICLFFFISSNISLGMFSVYEKNVPLRPKTSSRKC